MPRVDSVGEATRLPAAGESSATESAGEVAAGARTEDILADALTSGASWHLMDLSSWEVVDEVARGLEGSLESVLHASPADAPRFAKLLDESRSLRMRQFLTVALGVMGHDEVARYEAALEEPGLRAAAAFALGRAAGSRAIGTLLGALSTRGQTRDDRNALYFGLAQVGEEALPHLLEATEMRLLRGVAHDELLPLSFFRDPALCPALLDLAIGHGNEAVRIAAIHGFIGSGQRGRVDLVGLEQLALDGAQPLGVRSEALRGLTTLDEAQSRGVASQVLASRGADRELVHAALDAVATNGLHEVELEAVVRLALNTEDPETQQHALRALAVAALPESDRRLAELLPRLDAWTLQEVLSEIGSRTYLMRPSGRLGSEPAPELIRTLVDLLEHPELSDGQEGAILKVLEPVESCAELVSERAWERYAAALSDEARARKALLETAAVLGAEANPEIIDTFERTTEFVGRLELVSALSEVPGNLEREEVTEFLRGEVLPYVREVLAHETGAALAYTGPRRTGANLLATTVANLFGRFGDHEDLALLEGVGPAFLADNASWPLRLREATHLALTEATNRGVDIIRLREVK